MNRLSKVLLVIIVILTIALGIMTHAYFSMKKAAKENLNYYLEAKGELLKIQHPDANIEYPTQEN